MAKPERTFGSTQYCLCESSAASVAPMAGTLSGSPSPRMRPAPEGTVYLCGGQDLAAMK